MATENDYPQSAQDGHILAQIGRAFYAQRSVVRLRIPRQLAEQAVACWERYLSGPGLSPPESPGEWEIVQTVGALALIGQSLQENGVDDDEEVVVDLHAWNVGNALNAADRYGLLK